MKYKVEHQLYATIDNKIEEIAYGLSKKKSELASIGLCGDLGGRILFFAYLSKLKKSPLWASEFRFWIDYCFNLVSNGVYGETYSYSNGLSGILYLFHFLKKEGFINVDLNDAEKYFDNYLYRRMEIELSNRHSYDFLHGALGIGLYFYKKKDSSSLAKVLDFIELLKSIAIEENNMVCWKDVNNHRGNINYNISLSHGSSSIAIFLSNILSINICNREVYNLLIKCINFIISQKIDYSIYGSCYPHFSIRDEVSKSRLGWCYGDLGIAVALWQAGTISTNVHWQQEALRILQYSTCRKDKTTNRIYDACLCHGTAGISQIYRRMYFETREEKFRKASIFWIKETINIATHHEGIAGYKFYDNVWVSSTSLLEGVSGVGLSLIAALGDEEFSSWDELLLLHKIN